jgi:hypothetical protein
LPDWLGVGAVGHATAQAAACDGSRCIGHAPETLLIPAFAAERAPGHGRRSAPARALARPGKQQRA